MRDGGQGSTHLQINGLVKRPKIQPLPSSTHTQSLTHTTKRHTSEPPVGCLETLCYLHTLQSLVSAQEVMRAASHSCLSLFSFSLLLPQMAVSTILLFILKIIKNTTMKHEPFDIYQGGKAVLSNACNPETEFLIPPP